jgi:superfamily II DNA/RNA helicase
MDRAEVCDRFLDAVSFELYPFQEEALLGWFESEGGLLVAAPTGMGKTLIAEAAVFEALHTGQRLYYTTPLIALTDQKFRDLKDKAEEWGFSREDVGLITGNRRVNPDARVRVVVAEILLNHLLAGEEMLADVSGVVMDEFHYFNDFDRGIVWELSLALLPPHVRLMLLSATVGNAVEFIGWLREEHGRKLRLITSDERRVPLEFIWIGDKLLAEQLPTMMADNDADNRTPALVFCFHRDGCWEVAERLKGVKLTDQATRTEIEKHLDRDDFREGIGPKLRQMLICGVGVHHAGVLPKHKEVVEKLFLKKLIPFVVCTETLAAGINLPARSVVLHTLVKGKRGEKKLIPSSAAHQMFGRAGRPQFDTKGYVYALAHEDDVKIAKWRKKYDQLDANSKDPGILRAKKQLERKKPTRRKTEQYWSEGQLRTLIKAGPAKLYSRSMIPYQFLIYILTKSGRIQDARDFLTKRFTSAKHIEKLQKQLDHMVGNLAAFGYLTPEQDGDRVTVSEKIHDLLTFRSIDPLYGAFLTAQLVRSSFEEKIQALESVLPLSPTLRRQVRLPDLEPGPLQRDVLKPELIQMGLITARVEAPEEESFHHRRSIEDFWDDDEPHEPSNLPEMLKALFDARLASPEDVEVEPKWIIGGITEMGGEFYKYIRARNLAKNEGLVLRHLLRLVILAGEFVTRSNGDPEYERIGELATKACQEVDPRYTERFLEAEEEAKKLTQL